MSGANDEKIIILLDLTDSSVGYLIKQHNACAFLLRFQEEMLHVQKINYESFGHAYSLTSTTKHSTKVFDNIVSL